MEALKQVIPCWEDEISGYRSTQTGFGCSLSMRGSSTPRIQILNRLLVTLQGRCYCVNLNFANNVNEEEVKAACDYKAQAIIV